MRSLQVIGLAAGAAGHGYVLDPPPRAAGTTPGHAEGAAGSCPSGICFWFTDGLQIPRSATLGPSSPARTFHLGSKCGGNPWCAPGTATPLSPCGISSGGPKQNNNDGGVPATKSPGVAWPAGMDGVDLPELQTKTYWKAGGTAEIQWSLIANHGGGYQYRLCPKSSKPTEQCFEQTPLAFAGDQQWIQWCSNPIQYPTGYGGTNYIPKKPFPACDPRNRTAIPAVTVSTGTHPAGSVWMRNPIPACKGGGEFSCGDGTHDSDYQFPPLMQDQTRPGQLLGGFGGGECMVGQGAEVVMREVCGSEAKNRAKMFQFNIVDRVVVPKVPAGEYIMSFRWDCEGTPQIWGTCSDITITE